MNGYIYFKYYIHISPLMAMKGHTKKFVFVDRRPWPGVMGKGSKALCSELRKKGDARSRRPFF
jgi:hypothetical protein